MIAEKTLTLPTQTGYVTATLVLTIKTPTLKKTS